MCSSTNFNIIASIEYWCAKCHKFNHQAEVLIQAWTRVWNPILQQKKQQDATKETDNVAPVLAVILQISLKHTACYERLEIW